MDDFEDSTFADYEEEEALLREEGRCGFGAGKASVEGGILCPPSVLRLAAFLPGSSKDADENPRVNPAPGYPSPRRLFTEAAEEKESEAEVDVPLDLPVAEEQEGKGEEAGEEADVEGGVLWRKPIPGRACTSITLPDGRRRFVEILMDDTDPRESEAAEESGLSLSGRTTAEVELLFQQVEEMRTRDTLASLKEDERLLARLKKGKRGGGGGAGEGRGEKRGGEKGAGMKWTDKYAPRLFHELLTPEVVNRNVLKWVRLWDERVFGKPRGEEAPSFPYGWNPNARVLLLAGPAGVGKTVLAHVIAKQAGYSVLELNASDDRSATRLEERISATMQMQSVAFAGGKPRLVVLDEIDGMDTSAVDMLVSMIEATPPLLSPTTTSSSSTTTSSSTTSSSSAPLFPGTKRGHGGKGRRKGRRSQPLTRPVICTCNDLFAPVLRRLREHVQVLEISRAREDRLNGLLRSICRAEGLTATSDGLSAIVERCRGDIRACINTLQTVPGVVRSETGVVRVTADLIDSLPIGQRDETRSAFDLWETCLVGPGGRKGRAKARRRVSGRGGAAAAAAGGDVGVKAVLKDLDSRGTDARLLLEGLHHNFPQAIDTDSTLGRTAQCADWLSYADTIMRTVWSHGEFFALRFVPTAGAGIYLAARQDDLRVRPRWPRQTKRWRSDKMQRKEIVHSLLRGRLPFCGPAVGARDTRAAVLDLISPLLDIVMPPIQPINSSLLNSREKHIIAQAVSVLAAHSLSYVSSASLNPHSTSSSSSSSSSSSLPRFVLKPDVEALVRFKDYDPYYATSRGDCAPTVKEILGQEARRAAIRLRFRQERAHSLEEARATSSSALPAHVRAQIASASASATAAAAAAAAPRIEESKEEGDGEEEEEGEDGEEDLSGNFLKVLARRKQEKKAKRQKREAQQLAADAAAAADDATTVKTFFKRSDIVYKFQEGFTNAVRRPVRITEFF